MQARLRKFQIWKIQDLAGKIWKIQNYASKIWKIPYLATHHSLTRCSNSRQITHQLAGPKFLVIKIIEGQYLQCIHNGKIL